MKRLLIIGAMADGALEHWYAAAFRSLGVEVALFDPERILVRSRPVRIMTRPLRSLDHLLVGRELDRYFAKPQAWDVVLVFKGLFMSASALATVKRLAPGAQWFCFDPDSPFEAGSGTSSRHIRECIPLYDRYFIWSRGLVSTLAEHGCRHPSYLPFGFDDAQHIPAVEMDPSLCDAISFVGTYDRQRADLLESIADLPLRIFGSGWHRLPLWSPLRRKSFGPPVLGAELRRVVTSSLACINMLRPQNVGSHNMRTFEVPAMGGLMVTSRSAEQQEFFPEGEACLMYEGKSELRAVLQRLVRREIDTAAIRAGALKRVCGHSYRERARVILQAAGASLVDFVDDSGAARA